MIDRLLCSIAILLVTAQYDGRFLKNIRRARSPEEVSVVTSSTVKNIVLYMVAANRLEVALRYYLEDF